MPMSATHTPYKFAVALALSAVSHHVAVVEVHDPRKAHAHVARVRRSRPVVGLGLHILEGWIGIFSVCLKGLWIVPIG